MKKTVLIILLLAIALVPGFSQRLKYKNIFPYIQQGQLERAYSLLLDYQRQDPYFPNTYFQLGLISYKWALEADPLLDIKRVDYFVYNTKLYLGLAKKYLLEKKNDVRRNRKYYQNVPQLAKIEKPQLQDVLSYIDGLLKKINEYGSEVHKIYHLFYSMVRTYNSSVQMFRVILQNYPNIKDLYLSPFSDIKPQLSQLKSEFDSAMFYYQEYHTAITSYPLKNYHQVVKSLPIQTYRLDGITSTNFLSDTIRVWNYDAWVKDVFRVMTEDVAQLRSAILTTFANMMKYQKQILKAPYSDNIQNFDLPLKTVFQIEKYDYQSVMSAFFEYQKAILDYLAFEKHLFNDTTDTTVRFVVRAQDYKLLHDQILLIDSLEKVVLQRNTPKNVYKYRDFCKEFCQGNLAKYLAQRQKFIYSRYLNDLEHYKYFVFRDLFNYPFVKDSAQYKHTVFPLYINKLAVDSAETGQVVTLALKKLSQGIVLAGYKKLAHGANGFVALYQDGKIQWVKYLYSEHGSSNYVTNLSITPDAIAAVVHSSLQNGTEQNYVLFLDYTGKKTSSFELNNPMIVRYFNYDDINNVVFLGFRGSSLDNMQPESASEKLYLQRWNTSDKSLMWEKTFDLQGNLLSVQKMDTLYYVFVNSTVFKDDQGHTFKQNKNRIMLIRISEDGKLLDEKPAVNRPVWGLAVVKLNSELLNILALDKKIDLWHIDYKSVPPIKYYLMRK